MLPQPLNDLNDLYSSEFARFLGAVGDPPLRGFPVAVPSAPAAGLVDAAAVAREVFGTTVQLDNRDALLDLLQRALPETQDAAGKTVIANERPSFSAFANGTGPLVGPYATVSVLAQTLASNAAALASLKSLDSCATDCGDGRSLVGLIRDTIATTVAQLSRPSGPLGAQVEVQLATLTGYEPAQRKTFDVHTVGGYLGELRNAYRLHLKGASGEDEQMLTVFQNVVALTNMVAQAWTVARSSDAGDFLGLSIRDLRRNFFAIVASLKHLWTLADPAHWATARLPTDPPMVAIELWQWMYEYVNSQALPMLQSGGKPSIRHLAKTFKRFAVLLQDGFLTGAAAGPRKVIRPRGAQVCSDGDTDFRDDLVVEADDCDDVPSAFARRRVRKVVKEIICHIREVLLVAGDVIDDPTFVSHVEFENADGKPIEYTRRGEILHVRLCGGNLDEETPVGLRNDDGEEIKSEHLDDGDGWILRTIAIGKCKTGRWSLKVGDADGLPAYQRDIIVAER
jgi:hypothetical protein